MAKLTFIPNAKAQGGTNGLVLEDIPEEVRNDVEEVYAALKTNPGRMRVAFDTVAELNTYITQINAYCALRPAGEIRFRKSPSRGLSASAMDFRITDVATANEQTTAGIREATEKVAEAAATPAKIATAAKR